MEGRRGYLEFTGVDSVITLNEGIPQIVDAKFL
jgi:hypothetical protein